MSEDYYSMMLCDHANEMPRGVCRCGCERCKRVAMCIPTPTYQEVVAKAKADPVNWPHHYRQHPSGVECITITEHMNFNIGNAVKYLWRADFKENPLQDLRKAAWYVNREISRLEGGKIVPPTKEVPDAQDPAQRRPDVRAEGSR